MALPSKKEAFLLALETGTVRLFYDPTAAGVDAPSEPPILRYSNAFHTPMSIGNDGVQCQLSFDGKTRGTFVPWAAVHVLHEENTGAVMQWLPLPASASSTSTTPAEAPAPPKPRGLSVVR